VNVLSVGFFAFVILATGRTVRALWQRRWQRVGQVKLTQHRAFLGLMGLHPPQNVVKHLDRMDNMWALIEHHALGSVPHGGVRDFGASRHSFLGERLEHLSGPDDRHVGGFADPQDLLLHFGKA
jgi:hypothetical protein